MGIIIVGIILLIVGIILLKLNFDGSGMFLAFMGGSILFVALIIAGIAYGYSIESPIKYEADKVVFDLAIKNSNLTGQERLNVFQGATSWNAKIATSKKFRDDFWIGLFNYYSVGDLKPFDLSLIKEAKQEVQISK